MTRYRCCWPRCDIPLLHTPLACPVHLDLLSTPTRDKIESWAAGTIALTEEQMYRLIMDDWSTRTP